MIVNHIFRVNYHAEDAFPAGEEWIPDKTHDKDFLVFTEAVQFAKSHCDLVGACGIYQIDIDDKGREHETGNKWECTRTEHYRI